MRQRLGEVEGRARSDWSRADSMLRDAMAEVVDKAQVRWRGGHALTGRGQTVCCGMRWPRLWTRPR